METGVARVLILRRPTTNSNCRFQLDCIDRSQEGKLYLNEGHGENEGPRCLSTMGKRLRMSSQWPRKHNDIEEDHPFI